MNSNNSKVHPPSLIGLKEEAVATMLAKMGIPFKVVFRNGAPAFNGRVTIKSNILKLSVTQSVITDARWLL